MSTPSPADLLQIAVFAIVVAALALHADPVWCSTS
jgi:hypothetical protein